MLFPDFCEVNMFITQNLLLITFFDNYLKKKKWRILRFRLFLLFEFF